MSVRPGLIRSGYEMMSGTRGAGAHTRVLDPELREKFQILPGRVNGHGRSDSHAGRNGRRTR
jgi:hypothetical protein